MSTIGPAALSTGRACRQPHTAPAALPSAAPAATASPRMSRRGVYHCEMRPLGAVTLAVVLAAVFACGGGGSSNNGSGGGGSTTPANPCANALTADTAEPVAVGSAIQSGLTPPDKKT